MPAPVRLLLVARRLPTAVRGAGRRARAANRRRWHEPSAGRWPTPVPGGCLGAVGVGQYRAQGGRDGPNGVGWESRTARPVPEPEGSVRAPPARRSAPRGARHRARHVLSQPPSTRHGADREKGRSTDPSRLRPWPRPRPHPERSSVRAVEPPDGQPTAPGQQTRSHCPRGRFRPPARPTRRPDDRPTGRIRPSRPQQPHRRACRQPTAGPLPAHCRTYQPTDCATGNRPAARLTHRPTHRRQDRRADPGRPSPTVRPDDS